MRADIATDLQTGKSKGFGYVEYATVQEAEYAIETLNDSMLLGRPISVVEDVKVKLVKGQLPESSSFHYNYKIPNSYPENRGNRKVYVGNLPSGITWQSLKDFMRTIGPVLFSAVFNDGYGHCYGLVEFSDSQDCKKAILQLNGSQYGTEVFGSKIIVRDFFESQNIVKYSDNSISTPIGLNYGHSGPSSGYISSEPNDYDYSISDTTFNVPFYNQQSQYHNINPIQQDMQFMNQSQEYFEQPAVKIPPFVRQQVYVGNLAFSVTKQDLFIHFQKVAPVVSVDLMTTYDGKSKGCAIIKFNNSKAAATAMQLLNNTYIHDRQIYVREDREE